MELEEIYTKLCSLGIPVAYMKFTKPQKLPFLVYYESGTEIQGADTYNLYRRTEITVELYTQQKSPGLERSIEELFRDREISKNADAYLKDENMFVTAFSFDVYQYIKDTEEST